MPESKDKVVNKTSVSLLLVRERNDSPGDSSKCGQCFIGMYKDLLDLGGQKRPP